MWAKPGSYRLFCRIVRQGVRHFLLVEAAFCYVAQGMESGIGGDLYFAVPFGRDHRHPATFSISSRIQSAS
jgi:hypothetical protein